METLWFIGKTRVEFLIAQQELGHKTVEQQSEDALQVPSATNPKKSSPD